MSAPREGDRVTTRDGLPPFFRGEDGEHSTGLCDFLLADGDCCDRPAVYALRWKAVAEDLGTVPVSGACAEHVLRVDRNAVERMTNAPGRVLPDGAA